MSDLFAVRTGLEQFLVYLRVDLGELVRRGVAIVGIWLLAWAALALVGGLARRIERSVDAEHSGDLLRERRGKTLSQLLRSVGRVVVVVVALLMTFNLFVDIGPLLAGAGILGLAVSFGAQSLVKDVISGFFILLENQFSVGDVIEAGGKSGVVEKMTLRVVTLRDVEGTMHVVPNGEIKVVSNKTRGWARAVVDVGIAYDADVDQVMAVVRDEAERFAADPAWVPLLDGPIEVLGVDKLDDSAVVLRTLVRTQPGSQWSAGRELRRRLKRRFDAEGIEIPFPQRTVHLRLEQPPADAAQVSAAIRAIAPEGARS